MNQPTLRLYHVSAPNGGFLRSFHAVSTGEAILIARATLTRLGRKRGRVRLADPKRGCDWGARH